MTCLRDDLATLRGLQSGGYERAKWEEGTHDDGAFAPFSTAADGKGERDSTRFQGTASLGASRFGCTDTQNQGDRIMQARGTAGDRHATGEEDFSCGVTMMKD